MIDFSCPNCGNRMKVKDEAAGMKGKCKECGKTVKVPNQTLLASPPEEIAIPNEPCSCGGSSPVALQVNFPQEKRAAHKLGIASLILGILAFIIFWIPVVGMLGITLSVLGLLLGILAFVNALILNGQGVGFPIAGLAVSGISLLVAGSMTMAIFSVPEPLEQANEARQLAQEKAKAKTSNANQIVIPANNDDNENEANENDSKPVDMLNVAAESVPAGTSTETTKTSSLPKLENNEPIPDPLLDEWVNVTETVRQGDIQVQVDMAGLLLVPITHLGENTFTTDKHLAIRVHITNVGTTRKIEYFGWSEDFHDFADNMAMLTDENDNVYRQIKLSNADILGQIKSTKSIYPNKTVEEMLVFEKPISAAKFLKLELPAKAFGGEGILKIKIPTNLLNYMRDKDNEPTEIIPFLGTLFVPLSELKLFYYEKKGIYTDGMPTNGIVLFTIENTSLHDAGIYSGDILVMIDEKLVSERQDMLDWMSNAKIGETHNLTFYSWIMLGRTIHFSRKEATITVGRKKGNAEKTKELSDMSLEMAIQLFTKVYEANRGDFVTGSND